ncbi:hypothetical protein PENSPDRAFT_298268 [Peniophora sp. CONT]|nr:hypothetical protein PENSPDRAFT_298268 [Peniophora sp. CONT]
MRSGAEMGRRAFAACCSAPGACHEVHIRASSQETTAARAHGSLNRRRAFDSPGSRPQRRDIQTAYDLYNNKDGVHRYTRRELMIAPMGRRRIRFESRINKSRNRRRTGWAPSSILTDLAFTPNSTPSTPTLPPPLPSPSGPPRRRWWLLLDQRRCAAPCSPHFIATDAYGRGILRRARAQSPAQESPAVGPTPRAKLPAYRLR